jgi:hypothetical protein
VNDGVDAVHGLDDTIDLLDATLEELDVGQALKMPAIRGAADESTDAIAPVVQELGDMTAQEAAGPRNENFHGVLPLRAFS